MDIADLVRAGAARAQLSERAGPMASASPRSRGVLARRVLREPMIWFTVLGAALFLLSQRLDLARDTTIDISAGDVRQMAGAWQAQMGRSPTSDELASLVRQRVDEEVLSREALRRGLDKDDVIVRRRLAQKLEFILADDTEQRLPAEGEARAYFRAHLARYADRATCTFDQIFFSPDRSGKTPRAAAEDTLKALTTGTTARDFASLGDPFVLPRSNQDIDPQTLRFDYGEAFVKALETLPRGQLSEPIITPFGVHIVRVAARRAGRVPPFSELRDRVLDDMIQERRARDAARRMERLRGAYDIRIASADWREAQRAR